MCQLKQLKGVGDWIDHYKTDKWILLLMLHMNGV